MKYYLVWRTIDHSQEIEASTCYRVEKDDSLQLLVKGGRSFLTFFRVTWVFFSLHFKFFGTSVRKLQAKELLYVFDM
jgi:hypothetical protein